MHDRKLTTCVDRSGSETPNEPLVESAPFEQPSTPHQAARHDLVVRLAHAAVEGRQTTGPLVSEFDPRDRNLLGGPQHDAAQVLSSDDPYVATADGETARPELLPSVAAAPLPFGAPAAPAGEAHQRPAEKVALPAADPEGAPSASEPDIVAPDPIEAPVEDLAQDTPFAEVVAESEKAAPATAAMPAALAAHRPAPRPIYQSAAPTNRSYYAAPATSAAAMEAEPSSQWRSEARTEPGAISKLTRLVVTAVRYLILALAVWFAVMVVLIAIFRFVNPPTSALMLIRAAEGVDIDQRWVPLEQISTNLVRAVIVSEDGRFCRHWGIDPREVLAAIRRANGGTPRGASTMTMQLAKNLFLWPHQSYVRKALEVPLTLTIDALWPKERIAEVYLNVVEWGPGIFGAEAAARRHFDRSAENLTTRQSALLAVSLPSPIRRKPAAPSRLMNKMASTITARMRAMSSADDCVTDAR